MYTQTRGVLKPHSSSQSRIPLYVAGRANPVAFVRGDLLEKGIRPEHILRKPPGAIAFAETVLQEAARLGVKSIKVTDTATGTVYRCTFADFDRYRVIVNRGFGRQWALERGRWSINGAKSEHQAREEAQAAQGTQLALFEGVAQ